MAHRTPLIAGNWKMYKTGNEAISTIDKLTQRVHHVTDREIMVAPPFTALSLVSALLKEKGSPIQLGSQNLHHEKEGAFTGEISAEMLKDAGATHVIIGHSERREYFKEDNETICLKIQSALTSGLKPILCIGETEAEKNEEKTLNVLDKQIRFGLKGFRSDELSELIIAYEPVWAIGTGKSATPEEVEQIHSEIRSILQDLFDLNFSDAIRILYGGSVKPGNIKELMRFSNIDGALVGGASLDADSFSQIVNF